MLSTIGHKARRITWNPLSTVRFPYRAIAFAVKCLVLPWYAFLIVSPQPED